MERMQDGPLICKSRLCIRHFLDPQGTLVPTEYSTASRFSQRPLLSLASMFRFSLESWDVGNASQGLHLETTRRGHEETRNGSIAAQSGSHDTCKCFAPFPKDQGLPLESPRQGDWHLVSSPAQSHVRTQ